MANHRSIDAEWLLPDVPTLGDVIDFYESNVAGNLSYGSYQKRWSDFLREKLGAVRMDELRRQQLWDALWERYDWPSVRDALAQTKRAFNYAVKAPKHCRVDGPPPNPILHPLDNPLKGVVVNLKGTPSWKADKPSAALVGEMTTNSEPAWEVARTKKRAWEEEQREKGDPVVLQPPSKAALQARPRRPGVAARSRTPGVLDPRRSQCPILLAATVRRRGDLDTSHHGQPCLDL